MSWWYTVPKGPLWNSARLSIWVPCCSEAGKGWGEGCCPNLSPLPWPSFLPPARNLEGACWWVWPDSSDIRQQEIHGNISPSYFSLSAHSSVPEKANLSAWILWDAEPSSTALQGVKESLWAHVPAHQACSDRLCSFRLLSPPQRGSPSSTVTLSLWRFREHSATASRGPSEMNFERILFCLWHQMSLEATQDWLASSWSL